MQNTSIMELLTEIIHFPSSVSAYGWIPFAVVLLLTVLFSGLYVRHFWSQVERSKCSTIAAILGVTIALLAAFLLPVDVFLVSFMKNENGTFKDWATNSTRETLENTVANAYYSLYGIIFFYSFVILPFIYFAHEERDDDERNTASVLLNALVYTLVFLLFISSLLLAGAFIHYKAPPKNATDWDKIEFLFGSLTNEKFQDALIFVFHTLATYGMLNLILYTGFGLGSFPLTLMKGFRSLSDEELLLSTNQTTIQSRINTLRRKQTRQSLTAREIQTLSELEEEESLISRRSALLESEKRSLYYKFQPILRIINAVFGIIGIAFSLFLCISLLITNLYKLQYSLGYQMGYILLKNTNYNLLDYIMVQAEKIFPFDYVLFFSIIMYLFMCTVSAMRYLGICCLCVPMYKLRPSRTPPQGLILLSFILMFTALGFHVLMFSVLPNYATFGSQTYCKVENSTCIVTPCSLEVTSADCIMSRAAVFFMTFSYKAWIFSTIYFWATFGFLATFLLGLIIIFIRSKQSSLEEAIDRDDFDDSYDDQLIRA